MKKNFFGQPKEIVFCKKCVESNQRFVSSVQHKITKTKLRIQHYLIIKEFVILVNFLKKKKKSIGMIGKKSFQKF